MPGTSADGAQRLPGIRHSPLPGLQSCTPLGYPLIIGHPNAWSRHPIAAPTQLPEFKHERTQQIWFPPQFAALRQNPLSSPRYHRPRSLRLSLRRLPARQSREQRSRSSYKPSWRKAGR